MTLSTKIEVFTDLQLFAVGLHTCTAVARSLCVSWALLLKLFHRRTLWTICYQVIMKYLLLRVRCSAVGRPVVQSRLARSAVHRLPARCCCCSCCGVAMVTSSSSSSSSWVQSRVTGGQWQHDVPRAQYRHSAPSSSRPSSPASGVVSLVSTDVGVHSPSHRCRTHWRSALCLLPPC